MYFGVLNIVRQTALSKMNLLSVNLRKSLHLMFDHIYIWFTFGHYSYKLCRKKYAIYIVWTPVPHSIVPSLKVCDNECCFNVQHRNVENQRTSYYRITRACPILHIFLYDIGKSMGWCKVLGRLLKWPAQNRTAYQKLQPHCRYNGCCHESMICDAQSPATPVRRSTAWQDVRKM